MEQQETRVRPTTDQRGSAQGDCSAEACSLFLTPEWFHTLQSYGLPEGRERMDAVARTWKRELRLPLLKMGSHFEALASYYSVDFGVEGGDCPSTDEALQMSSMLRDRASSMDLRPMRADSPLLASLMPALRKQGFACDTYHLSTNWYLPCSGLSWDMYLASRPSRLANTLRRCRKRLEAQAGFRLEIVDAPAHLQEALTAYESVYAASWKEAEPYPEFIRELCQLGAERGWLRLGVLYLGDVAAAAQIWFVKDGQASIYKLAYDARFSKHGVGTVLTAALAQHVLEIDRVAEIDFLTGDDAYKAEWMSHCRELVGLIAFNKRSPLAMLKAAEHFGGKALRRLRAPLERPDAAKLSKKDES